MKEGYKICQRGTSVKPPLQLISFVFDSKGGKGRSLAGKDAQMFAGIPAFLPLQLLPRPCAVNKNE